MTSTQATNSRIYTAHHLISTAHQVIERGALVVHDSLIIAVSTLENLRRLYPHAHVTDYGASVITPGLINTHTHFELTAMRGFLDDVEHDFFAWLRKLTLARRDIMNDEDLYVSAMFGATEAIRSGVTCVADASDSAATTIRALHDTGLRAIVYQELFGIDARLAHDQLANLKNKVSHLRELNASSPIPHPPPTLNYPLSTIHYPLHAIHYPLLRVGISPHAPYTVSGKLIELAARYALDEDLPVMMHAAESNAELAFMMHGHGAFADGLKTRNITWQPPRVSTICYLHERGLLDTKPLLAHCITVDEHDLDLIKHHDASIAHCPKSNLKLGHGRAPLSRMLKRRIRTGLGSDSVASNNTNDIIEEARFALLLARANRETSEGAAFDVSITEVLEAATGGGAQALRMEHLIGTLEPDKSADFAVFNLTGTHQLPVHNPRAALIASSSGRDCIATIIAGREVFRNGKVTTIDEDDLRARVIEIGKRLAINEPDA
ncbi:MAG: amidohydrolase family protein [Pyrinomonadaceae bacterium MAG19_C2-C3]|nr:amidohydrolase family protein [Pyrinomonadaceae bacterium MAG19_C2-C3]